MKRRKMEEGLELVKEYRASGLTQERFAKKARINVSVLRYWQAKARRDAVGGTKPVRFVELTAADARHDEPSPVRIETPNGVVVRLERLPSSDYLVDLVLGLSLR